VSSIHSSAMGGVGVPAGYPPMFQGFTPDHWPAVQGGAGRRTNGNRARAMPESIAGESTVATESDITGSGVGGVPLDQLSINDVSRQTTYNQSDRLKRYVEGGPPSVFGGSSASMRPAKGLGHEDDAQSVSTAFASQVGGGYD